MINRLKLSKSTIINPYRINNVELIYIQKATECIYTNNLFTIISNLHVQELRGLG